MKILVLYPYVPFPIDCGTYQRTFHLLRELAKLHEVDLLALDEGGHRLQHRDVFSEFCRRVEFVPFEHPKWPSFSQRLIKHIPTTVLHWRVPALQVALDRVLRSETYDAVHVCDIVMAQYFLDRHLDLPMVIDRSRVDLQFQMMEHKRLELSLHSSLSRLENYIKLWFYERTVAQRARVQIVCGPDDQRFLHRFISRQINTAVLLNGVDLNYFSPSACAEARADEPTVIFCGTMDYSPNVDGMRWYFRRIHDRLRKLVPELRVLIVGKGPTPEILRFARFPEVTVTGEVPDVRPYYRKAWLQIVPLRIGGGTRLKIVESMALGTPVVSTSIGAQGLGLCHNNDVLIADTNEAFAVQTARALRDAQLRKTLQRAGLETVCSRLSWPMLGKQLNALYGRYFSPTNILPERMITRAA